MNESRIKVLKWEDRDIRFIKKDGEWLAFVDDLYQPFKNWSWPEESPYIRKHCHWLSEEHCWEYLLTKKEVARYFFASRKKEFKKFKRETFDRLLEEDKKEDLLLSRSSIS